MVGAEDKDATEATTEELELPGLEVAVAETISTAEPMVVLGIAALIPFMAIAGADS